MFDPNSNFKEQMAEARRTQILRGAAQVFAQKGFHKATTKEIAQAAGVSEGTIYNYFDNKRELLLAMVEMLGAQTLKSVILDSPPDDPREFLTMVLRDRFQLIQEHGSVLAPLVAEIFSDVSLRKAVYDQIVKPVTALMEQYLQNQVDAGQYRQVNPVIVTRAFMGALIINAGIKNADIDSRYDDISGDTLIEEIVSLFLDELLVPDTTSDAPL